MLRPWLPLSAPFASRGHLVISFHEASVPPQERADFIAFPKAEWTARQSRFSETDAKAARKGREGR